MLKKQNGITLIALIVTIIVLLILAGVSISMIAGENGISNKAQEAKEEQRYASVLEQRDLWKQDKTTDKMTGTSYSKKLSEVVDSLKEENLINDEEAESILGNGYVIINGKTIEFGLDPDGWDFAYVQISGGWSEQIKNGDELPEGDIIAKLYSTGKTVNAMNPQTGSYKTVDAYKMLIEGNGEMNSLGIIEDESSGKIAYDGWIEDMLLGNLGISSVTIDDGITKIGDFAFAATNMTEINIPNDIKTIGEYAFAYSSLNNINIMPSTVSVIGNWAFAGTPLTNINIPEGVTHVGGMTFAGCSSLTMIEVPSTIVSFCDDVDAFDFANNVTIKINKTAEEILDLVNLSWNEEKIAAILDKNGEKVEVPF